jgi:hypothetical protein
MAHHGGGGGGGGGGAHTSVADLPESGEGGHRRWDRVAEGEEGGVSFLGEEWKDVAVPDELAASCSGSKRYLHGTNSAKFHLY